MDFAAEAWAAAEIVAACAGEDRRRTGDEPETYNGAIASCVVDAAVIDDSLRVLNRLESDEDNEMSSLPRGCRRASRLA